MRMPKGDTLKSRPVLQNAAYQLLNGGLGSVVSVLHTALISRYLGVSGFGAFSLILTHVLVFYGLTGAGTDAIAVREMSKPSGRQKEWLAGLVALRSALAILAYGICIGILPFAHYPVPITLGILAYAPIIFFSPFESLLAVYQAQLRTGAPVLVTLATQVMMLAATAVAIRAHASLTALALIAASGTAARSLILGWHLRPFLRVRVRWSWHLWRVLLQGGLPLAVSSLCTVMIARFSFFILAKTHGLHAVGIFAAPYRLIYFLFIIPTALVVPVYPLLCRYWETDRARLSQLFQKSTDTLLLSVIPLAMGGFFMAEWLMRTFYGAAFGVSSVPFRILLLQLVFVFVSLPAGFLLIAVGREKVNLGINLTASLVGGVCLLWLTPHYSFQGVAWSLVVMQGVICFAAFASLYRLGLSYRPLASLP